MRTVRTKVYKFDELSDTAKEKAIEWYRNVSRDDLSTYDEAYESVKAFHKLFGTKEGGCSWLDCDCSNFNDDILNLRGFRLRTYIINNFWSGLFKGKYISLWSKTEKSHKYYKEGYPVLKSRYSKVIFDNSYTLTGVCWDMPLLQPLYDFLDNPYYYYYMDFETLMNECFESLEKDIDNEIEYQNSDEAITESLLANEFEFTKDGNRF